MDSGNSEYMTQLCFVDFSYFNVFLMYLVIAIFLMCICQMCVIYINTFKTFVLLSTFKITAGVIVFDEHCGHAVTRYTIFSEAGVSCT